VHLQGDCDDQVVLTPEDHDRFIRTQREIVDTMRRAENFSAKTREVTQQFSSMVDDIVAWCSRTPKVERCVISPRYDDVLVVIVATVDEADELEDAISALDLEMFNRNHFRLTWLLLRASEAPGIGSFVDSSICKTIYRADRSRASGGV
jgi:hypothetical protein